jgi:hypothetical protein
MRLIDAPLCASHASDIEGKLCEREGCPRFAALVVEIDGHDHASGAARKDELRVCDPCWEAWETEPMITLNGITMVRQGDRLHALPSDIGQG